ncbi:MAG TPA: glycosyltransferase family 39 protein [Bryobacteraceae bacterium]|nr:glycosyltransferase family 39 protein [Bryobacteraceae bacterium]
MSRSLWKPSLAILALFILYFYGIWRVGLVGPDEPRYASIGRAMASSGDWVTPRLWGDAWFEKPVLLYWLIGAAYKAGLPDDLAPRLPVAIVSSAFLAFYFFCLRREFGSRAAWFASTILATSVGWLAYAQLAVTDAPMAASFSACMLLCLAWLRSGERKGLLAAGVLLGFAVLAKGLVPLALAVPLAWVGRRRWTDLLVPAAACLATALPWYALCTLQNGTSFLKEFLWRHHFERFTSESLLHVQPFWYYVPVLLASFYPWTFLLPAIARQERDPRRILLLLWLVFGLIVFSVSQNKLPGYLLPLLPAAAGLMGLRLAEMRDARWVFMSAALLLALIPLIGRLLPEILLAGLSRTPIRGPELWPFLAAIGIAAACWFIPRGWGLGLIAGALTAGVLYLKIGMLPRLDEGYSARPLWKRLERQRSGVCAGDIHRTWRYGLNFYSVTPLPDCDSAPLRVQVLPGESSKPEVKIW